MMRRVLSDDGASAIEFAFALPVLLILFVASVPLVKAGWHYVVLDRAVAGGVRYAARADANARAYGSGLTRRPTAAEVQAFVAEASAPLTPSSVTVTPEPAGAVAGEPITVSATYSISFSPFTGAANRVKALFWGGGPAFPN